MLTVRELLIQHRESSLAPEMESRLVFDLLPRNVGKDVYNITAPFMWNDTVYLLGRVEARDSEASLIGFFRPDVQPDLEGMNVAIKIYDITEWIEEDVPVLELQDPFVTFVEDKIILGGVEITAIPGTRDLNYRTVFYRGSDPEHLERFTEGPWGMKDLRLKQLGDGRILLLTRPQGEVGGRGTIGWTLMDHLDQLTIETIEQATLLNDQFIEAEWGGGNEVHLLDGSKVGVLAHVARFDNDGNRHYYASAFTLDYVSGETTDMRIIAERQDFAPGETKRPDLVDVIFSGGLLRDGQGEAVLYCGTSDCEAHRRRIRDPFYD